MFETSWGEIFVMTGLCMVLIGRKDLPHASRFVGSQVGRVVGLLQGARMICGTE
jgi:Sec-independent protein translocase protein TatA